MVKIYIASDHAAFDSKAALARYLERDHEVVDLGPKSDDRCNYSEYAIELCRRMSKEEEGKCLGILLCGSGIGMSMAANRFKGIRAALCRTPDEARVSREHNDSNVLCLGGRISSNEDIAAMTDAWLGGVFERGRHVDRIKFFNDLGESP